MKNNRCCTDWEKIIIYDQADNKIDKNISFVIKLKLKIYNTNLDYYKKLLNWKTVKNWILLFFH